MRRLRTCAALLAMLVAAALWRLDAQEQNQQPEFVIVIGPEYNVDDAVGTVPFVVYRI